jgi:hypothetical protein
MCVLARRTTHTYPTADSLVVRQVAATNLSWRNGRGIGGAPCSTIEAFGTVTDIPSPEFLNWIGSCGETERVTRFWTSIIKDTYDPINELDELHDWRVSWACNCVSLDLL